MIIKTKIIKVLKEPKSLLFKLKGLDANSYFHILSLKRFSKKIGTMIDVGANKGHFIKALKKEFPHTEVYAFEPIKNFYDQLKKIPNVTAFNFGLWDDEKKAMLHYNKKDPDASSYLTYNKSYDYNTEIENVKTKLRRFDSFNIEIKRPCFLKLDVEGAEYEVLKGFGEELKKVDFILMERHLQNNFEGEKKFSMIFELLEEMGFTGFLQQNVNNQHGLPDQCDFFFFKFKF